MKIFAVTVAVCGLLAIATPADAGAFSFTTIDVPGAISTEAFGINGAGQIVGTFTDGTGDHSFLDTNGSFTTIIVPGASVTDAFGINGAGQIVGMGDHIFLDTNGSFTTINLPGGNLLVPVLEGINDSGQIVGEFEDSTDVHFHGFLYANGSFTTIDVPGATFFTATLGINNLGQIVGNSASSMEVASMFVETNPHGFLDTNGSFTTIDDPDGFFAQQCTRRNRHSLAEL